MEKEMADPALLEAFNEHFEIKSPLANMNTNRSAKVSDNSHRNIILISTVTQTLAQVYPAYIREIRHFYFGDREVNSSTMNEYTQMLSDALFTYGIYTTAIEIAKRPFGPTFYFEYTLNK